MPREKFQTLTEKFQSVGFIKEMKVKGRKRSYIPADKGQGI